MNNNYYKSMFKNYPDVVNVKELQLMLGGISKKLAYYLLQNNIIKSIKIGRELNQCRNLRFRVIGYMLCNKIAKVDVILYLTEKDCS